MKRLAICSAFWLSVALLLLMFVACEDKNAKCLEAFRKVNSDYTPWDEWEEATDYFRANCTWDGDRPVPR